MPRINLCADTEQRKVQKCAASSCGERQINKNFDSNSTGTSARHRREPCAEVAGS